jgi:hypothetical protein
MWLLDGRNTGFCHSAPDQVMDLMMTLRFAYMTTFDEA